MKLRTIATAILVALISTLAVAGPRPTFAATGISNGGFETGDLTGWQVYNEPGSSGSWYAYSGTTGPVTGFPVSAPPQGTYGATTDQNGAGTHILYQDFTVPSSGSAKLSLDAYYQNDAGVFYSPASLSYTTNPNQQYRIDVISPSAPIESVAASDILATVFSTQPGSPNSMAPTVFSVDLSAYAGQTVRLRLAEVDNRFFFRASADNVQLTTTTPTAKTPCKNYVCPSAQARFNLSGVAATFKVTEGTNGVLTGNLQYSDSTNPAATIPGCYTGSTACNFVVSSFTCSGSTAQVYGTVTVNGTTRQVHITLSGTGSTTGSFTMQESWTGGSETRTVTGYGIVAVNCP